MFKMMIWPLSFISTYVVVKLMNSLFDFRVQTTDDLMFVAVLFCISMVVFYSFQTVARVAFFASIAFFVRKFWSNGRG